MKKYNIDKHNVQQTKTRSNKTVTQITVIGRGNESNKATQDLRDAIYSSKESNNDRSR